jgi:hypothetical protein
MRILAVLFSVTLECLDEWGTGWFFYLMFQKEILLYDIMMYDSKFSTDSLEKFGLRYLGFE